MRPQPIPPSQVAVLIVGAGPTGLALACELARRWPTFRLNGAAPSRSPDRLAPQTAADSEALACSRQIGTNVATDVWVPLSLEHPKELRPVVLHILRPDGPSHGRLQLQFGR